MCLRHFKRWHYKHLCSRIYSFFSTNIYWTFTCTRHHLQNRNTFITNLTKSLCPHWIGKSCWDGQWFWKHLCPFEMKSRKKPQSSFRRSLVPQNGHTFIALVPESLLFQSSWHLPLCCLGQCSGQRKDGSSTCCCGGSLFGPRAVTLLVMAPTEHILARGYSQITLLP